MFAQPVGEDRRVRDHQPDVVHRLLPQGAVRLIADRVGFEQIQCAKGTARRRACDRRGASARGRGLSVSGQRVRQRSRLPQAAAIAAGRDLQ